MKGGRTSYRRGAEDAESGSSDEEVEGEKERTVQRADSSVVLPRVMREGDSNREWAQS